MPAPDQTQVLIVHSQTDAAAILAERLSREGHAVKISTGAQEALEICARSEPRVVLVQMQLPGPSGIELKRMLRARHPLLPVLVLESFRSIRSSEDLLRFGASDFILDADELSAVVERLAGGKPRIEDRLYSSPAVQTFLTNLIVTFTEMLGRAVPAFGPNQAEKRIVALDVCRRMGLPEDTARDVGIAALVYDLGKVKISEFILEKEEELSQQEALDLHNHCHWSLQLIERMGLPERIQQVVLHHHESYDGKGYPHRLVGRAIPIGSRILSVVDSFFAMISPRPYRPARTEEQALVELNRAAGTQFDPEVVEHFVRVIEERYRKSGEGFRREIAVVDDDFGALELMRFNFEREGYTVRCFRSAREALEKLPAQPPSLILADVVMPDMTGFDLLDRIRSYAGLRSVPFIFVSGSRFDEHDKVRGLDLGADDYMVKPIQVHELNARVKALLRRYQQGDGAQARAVGITGSVRELPLPDIVQLLYHGRKTAVIEVRHGGSRAEVFLERGNVVHVAISGPGSVSGVAAFVTVLGWPDAEFTIRHGVATEHRTIHVETSQLILQGLVDLDTIQRSTAG